MIHLRIFFIVYYKYFLGQFISVLFTSCSYFGPWDGLVQKISSKITKASNKEQIQKKELKKLKKEYEWLLSLCQNY